MGFAFFVLLVVVSFVLVVFFVLGVMFLVLLMVVGMKFLDLYKYIHPLLETVVASLKSAVMSWATLMVGME